ncbi:hypothetical protein [Aureimonas endophytica]|nr:hypothetical protein [Aureimonas endophytica]
MTLLDREVLRLWLAGESASNVLRHARRLGCTLVDETAPLARNAHTAIS